MLTNAAGKWRVRKHALALLFLGANRESSSFLLMFEIFSPVRVCGIVDSFVAVVLTEAPREKKMK